MWGGRAGRRWYRCELQGGIRQVQGPLLGEGNDVADFCGAAASFVGVPPRRSSSCRTLLGHNGASGVVGP